MDFIVGLPESCWKHHAKPYKAILVVVNWYTKQARYFLCHDLLNAFGWAEILARKLVLRVAGEPRSIVSDCGPQFTSKFWAAFCYHQRINHRLSTAYHPQTDRQTERQNQTLEQYLRAYVNYQHDYWVYWLPLAKFAYNNSVHASISITPFYAEKEFHPSIKPPSRPYRPTNPSWTCPMPKRGLTG
jgi:transposase InsO family protein